MKKKRTYEMLYAYGEKDRKDAEVEGFACRPCPAAYHGTVVYVCTKEVAA